MSLGDKILCLFKILLTKEIIISNYGVTEVPLINSLYIYNITAKTFEQTLKFLRNCQEADSNC